MSKLITVFTPTYNRADILKRLYDSLLKQTSNKFTWLIVDDGSKDNTENVILEWKKENKIDIEYYKQDNQGKSMAHNKGVELTKTELFVCVDSDDYLVDNAIEEIENKWKESSQNNTGILAFKLTEEKHISKLNSNVKECTLKDAYDKYGLKGDTMLIFKTSIINKYSFPYFEGEKFVPESYLYDLIDTNGKLIILDKYLYVCEYLDNGYTNNMASLLKRNPKGYFAYIKQRINLDTSIKHKFLNYIRYIALAQCVDYENIWAEQKDTIIKCLAYPFGLLLYLIKFKRV